MNTTVTTLYRDVTCGAAAALITLILSVAFIQSTSVPPGMHAADNDSLCGAAAAACVVRPARAGRFGRLVR